MQTVGAATRVWETPERSAQFSAMTAPNSTVIISAVSVGDIERNDRQTGQRLEAAHSTAPTLTNNPERAELFERLMGPQGILTAYGQELARIRNAAGALRCKNRSLLDQVRELQTRPTSRTKATRQ